MSTYNERKSVYISALQLWGAENQMIVALEEFGELSQAICKYLRGQAEPEVIDHIAEEMADCSIMLEQLQLIFGSIETNGWRDRKIDRLSRNIAKVKCGRKYDEWDASAKEKT